MKCVCCPGRGWQHGRTLNWCKYLFTLHHAQDVNTYPYLATRRCTPSSPHTPFSPYTRTHTLTQRYW